MSLRLTSADQIEGDVRRGGCSKAVSIKVCPQREGERQIGPRGPANSRDCGMSCAVAPCRASRPNASSTVICDERIRPTGSRSSLTV